MGIHPIKIVLIQTALVHFTSHLCLYFPLVLEINSLFLSSRYDSIFSMVTFLVLYVSGISHVFIHHFYQRLCLCV